MRGFRFLLPAAALAGLMLATGCQNKNAGDEQAEADSVNAKQGLHIVKAEPGPDAPDVQLKILSPAPDEVIKSDSVMVKVDLKGFDLSSPSSGEQSKGIAFSKDGQHIHVIVDDKPYMAMYVPDSFSVGKLSEGVHSIRAFPSRSWHESIKKPGAFVAENFYVKTRTGDTVIKAGQPLLTYSRPKGTYTGGDTKKILLDFYIANAELGPNKYKVIASIDGKPLDTLTEWVPYYIQGLSDGDHTVKLELIGPDGKTVPGRYNVSEQKITLNSTQAAPSPATMGHDTMAGGSSAAHQ